MPVSLGGTLEQIAERVVTLDERRRFPYETIVRLGRHFPAADRDFFSVPFDWTVGTRLYFLRDVVFEPAVGALYHDGKLVGGLPLDQPSIDALSGVEPDRVEVLDAATSFILGAHRFSAGFHHWLMTDLPAIMHCALHAPPGTTLLGPARPLAFHQGYLDLMGLARLPRIACAPGRQYALKHAIVSDFFLQHNIFQIATATLQTFADLRRRVPRTPTPERVYISRGQANHRRVLNEDALQPLLRRHGYTTVRLETMSLPMQINMFRNARSIVAPHGAGLTNLGFCSRGTHVFEMLTEGWVNGCFNVLAKATRLQYWADVYPGQPGVAPIGSDFTIELASFAEILGDLESHVATAQALDAWYAPLPDPVSDVLPIALPRERQ
jgi:hypothetical protein